MTPTTNQIGRSKWSSANILSAFPELAPGTTIVWSGWFGDSAFERDPRAWLPSGWDALATALRAQRERLEHLGSRWLLRPHARHVLNDPQRCAKFADTFAGPVFGLALDPVAMLEPGMLEKWEDHVERAVARLAPLAACAVVCGADLAGAGENHFLRLGPKGAAIPVGAVRDIIRARAPTLPILDAADSE
ncbi:MAG: hypothetical protein J0L61_00550 [Planctomycetes bacterium]|nr:hypothetical protein [Planctomycetota bacterium]